MLSVSYSCFLHIQKIHKDAANVTNAIQQWQSPRPFPPALASPAASALSCAGTPGRCAGGLQIAVSSHSFSDLSLPFPTFPLRAAEGRSCQQLWGGLSSLIYTLFFFPHAKISIKLSNGIMHHRLINHELVLYMQLPNYSLFIHPLHTASKQLCSFSSPLHSLYPSRPCFLWPERNSRLSCNILEFLFIKHC